MHGNAMDYENQLLETQSFRLSFCVNYIHTNLAKHFAVDARLHSLCSDVVERTWLMMTRSLKCRLEKVLVVLVLGAVGGLSASKIQNEIFDIGGKNTKFVTAEWVVQVCSMGNEHLNKDSRL